MLPRIVDIFEDRDCIYIVEDFVEGITLDGLLKQQKKVDEAPGATVAPGSVRRTDLSPRPAAPPHHLPGHETL